MLRRCGMAYPDHGRFNEAGARAPRMLPRLGQPRSTRAASMRPGRARPGCGQGTLHATLVADASMRPGRARPGCFAPDAFVALTRLASMRPGRARPGCRDGRYRAAGFPTRFNEAGARAPRMHGCPQQADRHRPAASMRPGRARPGCPAPGVRADRPRHRFNEAGARAPRMPRQQQAGIDTYKWCFNEAGARAPWMLRHGH